MLGFYLLVTSIALLFGGVTGLLFAKATGLGILIFVMSICAQIGWTAREIAGLKHLRKAIDFELKSSK